MKKRIIFSAIAVLTVTLTGILMSFTANTGKKASLFAKSGLCYTSIPLGKFVCWYTGSECTKSTINVNQPSAPEQVVIDLECEELTFDDYKCYSSFPVIPCILTAGFKECDPAAYPGAPQVDPVTKEDNTTRNEGYTGCTIKSAQ